MVTNESWGRLKELVKKRDKCICQYCGRFDSRGEVDHILPLSRGGSDAIHNLSWACRKCNRSKGNKTLQGWVQYLASNERRDILDMIHDFLEAYGHIPENLINWAMNQPGGIENTSVSGNLFIMHFISEWMQEKFLLLKGMPEEIIFAAKIFKLSLGMMLKADKEGLDLRTEPFKFPEEMVISNKEARQEDLTRLDDDELENLAFLGTWAAQEVFEETSYEDSIDRNNGDGQSKVFQFPLWK